MSQQILLNSADPVVLARKSALRGRMDDRVGLESPPPFTGRNAKPPFSLEWAAGFLDGEGCIHVAKQTYRGRRSDTYGLRVHIVQNNLEVLRHFQEGVGIHARIYAVRRKVQHNRQVYTLNYHGASAMQLILLLGPYLTRKRLEAITAWQFWVEGCVGMRPGPRGLPPEVAATRERLYRKLRQLK